MNVKATIEVEFEMNEGQPENAANAAIIRGLGSLSIGIERGSGAGLPTGVKPGSVRTKVVHKEIL